MKHAPPSAKKEPCIRCGSEKCADPDSKTCSDTLIQKLQKDLAKTQKDLVQERKDCIQALADRDYNGLKWRHFEVRLNETRGELEAMVKALIQMNHGTLPGWERHKRG